MTREKLLKASVRSFQDTLNPAYAYQYKIVNTAQGYSYIAIDYKTKRSIVCAIHLATSKEIFEAGGIIAQTEGQLSTRDALKRNEMVIYKDYFIFWNSFNEYNETMRQYMYDVRVLPPNDKILLHKLNKIVGNTCYDKIAAIPNYAILPNHADITSDDFTSGLLLLECKFSEAITPTMYNRNGKLSQQRVDEVIFTAFNLTRAQGLKFMKDLQDYSLSSKEFGFIELPYIADETYIDKSNAIKSLIAKIYAKISYNLIDADSDDGGEKIIRNVIYRCFNLDYLKDPVDTEIKGD